MFESLGLMYHFGQNSKYTYSDLAQVQARNL
jgi:hypothetical protein